MSTAVDHNPGEPLGSGRTIIEASAGTGKTYAIAAEVTSLLALEDLDLAEILVVTFTRAATAELRARVRGRMLDTLRVLEGEAPPPDPDGYLQAILGADAETKDLAAQRLGQALTRFDDAQIFTIHGFAMRLLAHLGFRSRVSPDLEPGAIDRQLLTQVAGDLVVARFARNPSGDEIPTLNALIQIGEAVVGTPDARIVPDVGEAAGIVRTRVELAHTMGAEMKRRLQIASEIVFDDSLVEARDALADPEVGDSARKLLQDRYAIALVDEAQDTDPIQWRIIRSVFDDRMVVVGDPKQSIYSFRGADLESYLATRSGADAVRALRTNWRSDGPLLTALDTLFRSATFGDDRIEYHPMEPAPGHEAPRLHGAGAPLTIHRFHADIKVGRRNDGYFRIDAAREAVAADVAAGIVRLLSGGTTIDDDGETRPVSAGDVAVLCRTRRQVDFVRNELAKRRVPSVTSRTTGVFASPAAEEWRRFLLAVERPDRNDLVRMAAVTLLVGRRPDELAAMSDADILALQHQVAGWHALLQSEGVPALVADLHRTTGLAARVLARPDGERTMTDIDHIAEEMHSVWRRRRVGSLSTWIEGAIDETEQREQDNVEEPESRQRRLETDADAVQIQTIHAAKGLEYPVVYVPYAWDKTTPAVPVPVFHDPAAPAEGTPRPRLIDVGGKGSADFDTHVGLAKAEGVAEEGRLLYVALTRAKHRLHVWWIEEAEHTADAKLTELIHRGGRDVDRLAAASDGTIAVTILRDLPPVEQYEPDARPEAVLDRARFERPIDPSWQRASFTSLSSDHPLTTADTAERPLRSDESISDGADEEDQQAIADQSGAAIELPMVDLPRGARFGTLVHEVLERVDFSAPDLETEVRLEVDRATRRSVTDFDHDQFVAGLLAAIETPLGPEPNAPRLSDLDSRRLLRELSFDLPVRTRSEPVSLRDLGDLMLEHLPADDPYRPFARHLRHSKQQRFRGYLAGAIDLTIELPTSQAPRFVVVDYKSNTLPSLGDAPRAADYGPGPLAASMISGNYVLQATIYQVALHRYLQWRLAGYEPSVHLGGAMYLFVRGMVGADTPVIDDERCGVARWHPPASFIVAVSDLFKEGGA